MASYPSARREEQELVLFRSGTSEINVYRSDYAGTNKATAATWTVDNVKDEVADLSRVSTRVVRG